MSVDDPQNPDKSNAKKKKSGLIRADGVGGLDRDEESVVEWVEDDPEPTKTVSAETAETGTDETIEPPADPVTESPPPEPEAEIPPPRPPEEPEETVAVETDARPPEKQEPLEAVEAPRTKEDTPTPADPTESTPKTELPPADPTKPAQVKRPDPPPTDRPSARDEAPDEGLHEHMRPVTPPVAPKKRKPLTSRILLWGFVLIIITVTVGFFATYEAETPAPLTAETGQLFHKIPPVPSSVARGSVPKQPVSATPPKVPDQAAAAPAVAKPQPVPAPVKKPMAPKAPTAPKTPAPEKVKAPKAKSTVQLKPYVPRRYPYAIHVASFQSLDTAHGKLADYRRGFQAYVVRTNLGEKGIWYRLFLGHFPSATAALDAIKKYRLKGALVARNRFACLVGAYTSTATADQSARQLSDKGFLPYTVTIDKVYYLFVGAHPTVEAARSLLKDLAASGFTSELMER